MLSLVENKKSLTTSGPGKTKTSLLSNIDYLELGNLNIEIRGLYDLSSEKQMSWMD